MTSLSVVIPTHNRLPRLRKVLAGFATQTCSSERFDVIVVSDGSTDGTEACLAGLAPGFPLVVISQPHRGVSSARNAGVAHARGEIVLFVDDDVVPSPELIEEHLREHEAQGGDVVVIGPIVPPEHTPSVWVRWEEAMLEKLYRSVLAGAREPTARMFFTCNASLKRSHFLEADGFDPRLRRGEDVELGFRLEARGLRFRFNPRAKGYHWAERDYHTWAGVALAYGRRDGMLARRAGTEWLLPTLLREYRQRDPLVRALTMACVGRAAPSRSACALLRGLAETAHRARLAPLARAACSGIFNLRYYEGLSAELGGRRPFFDAVAAAQAPGGDR